MSIQIKMPKLSDTMTEGVLVSWKMKPGAPVKTGDILAEVETDKAVMPVENFDDGVLARQVTAEGSTVAVGAVIALLAVPGEDWQAVANEKTPETPAVAKTKPTKTESRPATPLAPPSFAETARIKASPLARKMAGDQGIDLSRVTGSGPDGRITQKDILTAVEVRKAAPPVPSPASAVPAGDVATPVTGTRATVARRMAASKAEIPHFYAEVDLHADKLASTRAALKASLPEEKITVNDFIIRACALALRKHPQVNSHWHEGQIVQHGAVNIAVGVAVEGGLLAPVLRDVDRMTLRQVSSEFRKLAEAARTRKLTPAQMTGSGFTITNMGMLGITRFAAIINPPESAILAVGTIREEPVVRNGQVVPGQRLSLTISADHRVIDGAAVAAFLATLRVFLEEPLALVV